MLIVNMIPFNMLALASSRYKVTFHLRGGNRIPKYYDTQWIDPGEYATEPGRIPTKSRRTFYGWTTPESLDIFDFKNTPINENTYLQARWTFNFTYGAYDIAKSKDYSGGTISFNGGAATKGSATPVTAFDHIDGQFSATPDEGYIFRGWWINGNQYSTDPNMTVTPGTNYFGEGAKIEARFDYWTVSFDTNGGSKVTDQKVPVAGKAANPGDSATTKKKCTFGGWYQDKELKVPFDFDNTTITKDTTIYAKWVYAVLALPFATEAVGSDYGMVKMDDGEWSSETITKNVDPGKDVRLQAKANPGYKFVEWRLGDETLSTEADFRFTPEETACICLAMFAPAWKVTYDLNGGESGPKDRYVDYGGTITLPEYSSFNRPGWHCYYYKVKVGDGEEESMDAGDEVTVTADTTVKAMWREFEYIIDVETISGDTSQGGISVDTYSSEGASVENKYVNTGSDHEVCAFPAEGFVFDRWEYEVISGPSAGETGESHESFFTINAGKYTVNDRIEFKAYFRGAPMKITVTGNKSYITYDGKNHSVTGYVITCTDPTFDSSKVVFSGTDTVEGKNVGEYDMGLDKSMFTYNVIGANVEFVVSDGKLTINTARIDISVKGNKSEYTFDGNPHSAVGYVATASNIAFDQSKVVYDGDAIVTQSITGFFPMGLMSSKFSYTDENVNAIFTVSDGGLKIKPESLPYELTITVTGHTLTDIDNKSLRKITGYDLACDNDSFDPSKVVFTGEAVAQGIEVGFYPMGIEAFDFSYSDTNYTAKFLVVDGWLRIKPNHIEPNEMVISVTGKKDTVRFDTYTHELAGYDLECDNPAFDTSKVVFTGEARVIGNDVGIYPMGLTPSMFTYNDPEVAATFLVADGMLIIEDAPIPFEIIIVGHNKTATYTGEEQNVLGFEMECESEYFDPEKVTFDGDPIAKGTEVGKYQMGLAPIKFGYDDANFDVFFEVTDGWLQIDEDPGPGPEPPGPEPPGPTPPGPTPPGPTPPGPTPPGPTPPGPTPPGPTPGPTPTPTPTPSSGSTASNTTTKSTSKTEGNTYTEDEEITQESTNIDSDIKADAIGTNSKEKVVTAKENKNTVGLVIVIALLAILLAGGTIVFRPKRK